MDIHPLDSTWNLLCWGPDHYQQSGHSGVDRWGSRSRRLCCRHHRLCCYIAVVVVSFVSSPPPSSHCHCRHFVAATVVLPPSFHCHRHCLCHFVAAVIISVIASSFSCHHHHHLVAATIVLSLPPSFCHSHRHRFVAAAAVSVVLLPQLSFCCCSCHFVAAIVISVIIVLSAGIVPIRHNMTHRDASCHRGTVAIAIASSFRHRRRHHHRHHDCYFFVVWLAGEMTPYPSYQPSKIRHRIAPKLVGHRL